MSNILIISGSSQADSQSLRISHYLKQVLEKQNIKTDILDLHKNALPIFQSNSKHSWDQIKPLIEAATSFIWVIPEWNGGANPSLKNLLLYAGNNIFAHKPVLLIGISAGIGGFYPLMDVRSSGQKDARYVLCPESIVINHCTTKLNNKSLDNKNSDDKLKQRINYALNILNLYDRALNSIRLSTIIDHKTYPFSM